MPAGVVSDAAAGLASLLASAARQGAALPDPAGVGGVAPEGDPRMVGDGQSQGQGPAQGVSPSQETK